MSKYNNKKVDVDGITFDSEKEAMYYKLLKDAKRAGSIASFEIQPKFELQASFRKNGILHRAITYSADFEVVHNDGAIETIDIKGFETAIFKLKMKLFEKKYPERSLILLKYSKLDGGFVSPEVYKAGVKKRKEERAIKKAQKEREKAEKARLREEKKNGK